MRLYKRHPREPGRTGVVTLGVPDEQLREAVAALLHAEPECEFFLVPDDAPTPVSEAGLTRLR
jgi:hypothetical protein